MPEYPADSPHPSTSRAKPPAPLVANEPDGNAHTSGVREVGECVVCGEDQVHRGDGDGSLGVDEGVQPGGLCPVRGASGRGLLAGKELMWALVGWEVAVK